MTHVLTLSSGEQLRYQLAHRQRRSVGLKISASGLVVHAPKRISLHELETILEKKSDWILKKLAALMAKQVPAMRWQHGESLLYLGSNMRLVIEQDAQSKVVHHEPGILQLALPDPQDTKLVARKVVVWYKKQALQDFSRRLEIFSSKLGVSIASLALSNASSRWGSCNSRKQIRLNWRLLQAPPHIINYVVCHELAHLKEMNHSAKFWATVASICPEYKVAEKELKSLSATLHRI
ncbi:MAG: M48 family metallopeptidase [Methylotenera sp.]|nr:M48 family metallopeptidase [Methylotenera sp.]